MRNVIGSLLLGLFFFFSHVASAATEEDPWEGFNRAMFSFNDAVDGAILKPVAEGYKAITPNPVQKGVSNFFSNLGEIGNITNNLLQGKWDETASSTFRFLINSTAGWLGIFDVASEMGLKRYKEDFGQTLGYWGVSSGPYLVLPFFGPSTVRDGSGLVLEYTYIDETEILDPNSDEKLGLLGLDVVETRARLLSAESMIIGDRYSFVRDVYLQSRAYDVYDGNPPKKNNAIESPDSANDDSWGEEAAGDSWGDETSSDSWGDDVSTSEETDVLSEGDFAADSSWSE
ncbi:VacJ family lipoprotein [Marinomonas shanghaiensis]|uniref:MlaA family lipoprotein n=1 Tax=Marinomonas shanghaiensis TaxID=2202418 RepID=UPI003A8E7230